MNSEIRYLAQQLLHGGLGPLCERDRRVIARVARRGDRTYVLTCSASYARVQSALDALQAATGVTAAAFPAVAGEESAC